MEIQITPEVIKEVEKLVNDKRFVYYLTSNTVNLESAAFILQTLLTAIDEVKETLEID